MSNRLERLRDELNKRDLDAMLISSSENRAYLSGFVGSAGYLLITKDAAVIATDFRYVEQAKYQAPHYEVVKIGNRDQDWFAGLIQRMGISNLGFEGDDVTVSLHERLLTKLKDLKGPIFLVAFWSPLRIDKNGKIFYRHHFSYETGKWTAIEELFSDSTYKEYKRNDLTYHFRTSLLLVL